MTAGDGARVDTHVKVLDEGVVERAKRRGMDALVYAPHFTRLPEVRRRAERFADDDLAVIPAREVFTGHWQTRRHVLAVGLAEPVPDFITLAGAMAEFDRQDATVVVPHPSLPAVGFPAREVAEYADRLDAVEVYTPKQLPQHVRRARRVAAENGLPAVAASSAHLRGTVGQAWTTFEDPVRNAEDFAAALADGEPLMERRSGARHRLRAAAEVGHLLWENSWGKLDRTLLQGTAPTHPDHVAYDGRFDDVRVY